MRRASEWDPVGIIGFGIQCIGARFGEPLCSRRPDVFLRAKWTSEVVVLMRSLKFDSEEQTTGGALGTCLCGCRSLILRALVVISPLQSRSNKAAQDWCFDRSAISGFK